MANLVAECIGTDGTVSHGVIDTADYLARVRDKADPVEWRRVEGKVVLPSLRRDADGGCELHFCSLYGWMHSKAKLIRHRFAIGQDFSITGEARMLSQKLITKFPDIEY